MSYQDSYGLGNQPDQSTSTGSTPSTVLPPNPRGVPTVEGLSIVLQQAQRLLADHAVPAISVSTFPRDYISLRFYCHGSDAIYNVYNFVANCSSF